MGIYFHNNIKKSKLKRLFYIIFKVQGKPRKAGFPNSPENISGMIFCLTFLDGMGINVVVKSIRAEDTLLADIK